MPEQVAQDFLQERLLSFKESNPVYYNDIQKKLLLLKENNNLEKKRVYEIEILSFYENILTKPKTIQVYKFFLEKGASTVRELAKAKYGSYSYIYKIISDLKDAGFILPYTKIKTTEKNGGAPCTVYGHPDATEKEIQYAVSRYLKSFAKIYVFVEQLYQRTLYEIIDEQIQYKKIIELARQKGNNRFHFMDMANEVALRLQDDGIKVWQ
jgi:predicted transcriptional regulator